MSTLRKEAGLSEMRTESFGGLRERESGVMADSVLCEMRCVGKS